MATGRKEIRLAVGHAGGNGLCLTGRAERIIFSADGQDRAGDLFDRISLAVGGCLDVKLPEGHILTETL